MWQEIAANQNQNIRYNIGIEYMREPAMPYTPCDVIPIQLKSSFDAGVEHKLEVYEHCDLNTILETIPFELITENRMFWIRYHNVKLADGGSETDTSTGVTTYFMYIYFETGSKEDAGGNDLGNYYLNGEIPSEFSEISYDNVGIYNSGGANQGGFYFADPSNPVEYVEDLNAFAIKVILGNDFDTPGISFDPAYPTGSLMFNYLRDTYNTLQANLDLAPYTDKNLRLKIIADEGGTNEAVIFSEPIMVRKDLPGMLRVSWVHSTDKFYTEFYKDGFHPFAYLPMRLFDILPDEIEDKQMTTDKGKQLFIQSTYSERYKVVGWLMPRWMVRLVDLIFKLDIVMINGEQYQKIGSLEADKETEKSDRFSVELTVNKVKTNGVYDDDYDFDHQTKPENYKYLKIDSAGNRLKIDEDNLLKTQN
jgi:hypothetical protein